MAFTTDVAFSTLAGWPRDGFEFGKGFFAEWKVKVAWENRFVMMFDFLDEANWRYPFESSGGAVLPSFFRGVTCEPWRAEGGGWSQISSEADAGELAYYDLAILTAHYTSLIDKGNAGGGGGGELLMREYIDPTNDWDILGVENMTWDVAGTPAVLANEYPKLPVPGFDYILERYFLPAVPSNWVSMSGYINNTTLTTRSMGMTFAPQTVRYTLQRVEASMTTSGSRGYTVIGRFQHRPKGWQKYRRSNGLWERIKVSGSYLDDFPQGDLNALYYT